MADNLNQLRPTVESDAPSAPMGGFTRSVEGNRRIGRAGLAKASQRLYRYDRVQGLSEATFKSESDQASRMSKKEAAQMLHTLHEAHGVATATEGFLVDYDNALFICYALNGSSQFTPSGRVHYRVRTADGTSHEFDYETIHTISGVDFRRFFRAFAGEVYDACRRLYEHCDFNDPYDVEERQKMIELADVRGVQRAPYLIADCVDAVMGLDANERMLALTSKARNIGNSTNAVDRRNLATPIRSLDNYDSSVGRSVNNQNDITAGSEYYP